MFNTYHVVAIQSPFNLYGKDNMFHSSDTMHNLKKDSKDSVTTEGLIHIHSQDLTMLFTI